MDDKSKPSSSSEEQKDKVHLLLLPVGSAPIIRKKNFKVDPNYTVGQIVALVRRLISLDNSETLFIYVNQIFAPSLEQTVQNLFNCFGCDGKLIFYYATSQAWG